MYSIRQESLFSLEQLLEMSPNERYGWLFETVDITPILRVLNKKSNRGAPETLNYRAMVFSLFIRVVERMPFVKDLVNRLHASEEFRYQCRFTGADEIPSEAAYSRLFAKLAGTPVFAQLHDRLVAEAFEEGFIDGVNAAVDATHLEARDASTKSTRKRKKQAETAVVQAELNMSSQSQQPTSESQPKPSKPKKRGRKSKAEREQWLQEQAQREAEKNAFEKTLVGMVNHSLEEIEKHMPQHPSWGTKKNTENKKIFWYGYKGHLAVDCESQYILVALFSSAHVNDGKMSIPLLKALAQRHPYLHVEHVLADAGYDFEAVYRQIRLLGSKPLIDYNPRNEGSIEGKDEHFRPVCKQGHSYVYDSYDPKYETLKYTQPKECANCPFLQEGGCQRVHKIKVVSDIRKYTVPARGSQSYKELYNKRTAVERVNAYLKEFFQLNNIRHRGGALAKVDFDISCLVYTISKLAVDRMNKQMKQMKEVA